jgi:hypothetical protein
MFIHELDKTETRMKITDEGDLFIYCPECKGIWEMPMKVVKKPREVREINYGGSKLTLNVAMENKEKKDLAVIAKTMFPEAYT